MATTSTTTEKALIELAQQLEENPELAKKLKAHQNKKKKRGLFGLRNIFRDSSSSSSSSSSSGKTQGSSIVGAQTKLNATEKKSVAGSVTHAPDSSAAKLRPAVAEAMAELSAVPTHVSAASSASSGHRESLVSQSAGAKSSKKEKKKVNVSNLTPSLRLAGPAAGYNDVIQVAPEVSSVFQSPRATDETKRQKTAEKTKKKGSNSVAENVPADQTETQEDSESLEIDSELSRLRQQLESLKQQITESPASAPVSVSVSVPAIGLGVASENVVAGVGRKRRRASPDIDQLVAEVESEKALKKQKISGANGQENGETLKPSSSSSSGSSTSGSKRLADIPSSPTPSSRRPGVLSPLR